MPRAPSSQLSLFHAAPPGASERSGALLVLPDGPRVSERLHSLLRQTPLVVGKPVCTLADLERALIESAQAQGKCPRVARPAELELVYAVTARERTPPGSPFSSLRNTAGFAAALRALSRRLVQGRLPPEEAEALALGLEEPTRAKLQSLLRVLVDARAALGRVGLCEPGEALRLAVRALQEGGPLPTSLAKVRELRVEQVLDWPPLRIELFCALSVRLVREGGEVKVALPYFAERPHLADEALGAALKEFEARGALGEAPELELDAPVAAEALEPWLSRMFLAQKPAPDARVRGVPVLVRSAASPSAEAREAAARCAQLLAEGTSPERIAVVARSLTEPVVDELGAALDRLQLPWRERRGRVLASTGPARLALSMLGLEERGFPREELISLLCAPSLELAEEGERLRPQQLAAVLREARVRDDRTDGGFAGRLGQLAARLSAQAEGADEKAQEWLGRARERTEEARTRSLRALETLRALPPIATLPEHAAALARLLERWGFFRAHSSRLPTDLSGAPGPLARASLSALARERAAVLAVGDCLHELGLAARAVALDRLRIPRAEFARLLGQRFSEETQRPGGARGGAVALVELRELAGRSFDHLIVVGLLDGQLPAGPAIDPLLSDEDKRALNRAARRAVFRAAPEGDALVLPPRMAEEPLAFLLGLHAASRSITLLFPRADAGGRELVRSTFADEAARALGIAVAELSLHTAPLQPIPQVSRCSSSDELLARASLEAFAEPAWRVSQPLDPAAARGLAARVLRGPLRERFLHIARAALAERERLRAFVNEIAPARYSGQLGGRALELAAPLFRFDVQAPVSASRLEDAAHCLFRLFGKRVLGLEEEDEPLDDLAAHQRGTLLHRILEALYGRLHDAGLLPLRPAHEDQVLALLDEIASAEMETFARTEPVGHRGLWKIRREELLRTARAVVRNDLREGADPLELERRFGPDADWPPVLLPSPDGRETLVVRGAIDRVDRQPGANGKRALLVLDYKSRGIEGLKEALRTDRWLDPDFQLLVYAAALRAKHPEVQVDAALYSLRNAQKTMGVRAAAAKKKPAVDLEALLALDPQVRARQRTNDPEGKNLADAAWRLVDSLRAGTLPVQPLACDYCQLKPVCRIVALPEGEEETA